ncbi:MAG: hypothetical protein SWE60_25830 [Thermodesulfobacteriota bacterium]|nr:hypothetical protein [Thermodesulfobacteriota bacterium]
MNSKMGIVALVVGLMFFTGLSMASPPLPTLPEGFNIPNNVDVDVSVGDRTKMEQFIPTWLHDINDIDAMSLAHPEVAQSPIPKLCHEHYYMDSPIPKLCQDYYDIVRLPQPSESCNDSSAVEGYFLHQDRPQFELLERLTSTLPLGTGPYLRE